MKKIAILGSTGSIGTQTLDVVRANDDLEIVGLSAGNNIDKLEEQIREFHPRLAAVWNEDAARDLAVRVQDLDVKIVSSMDGLLELARMEEADILVVDFNINRGDLLPSEKARAYKLKLDAMKHQGERVDLTSSQVGTKLRADEILAQQAGSSRNQVQRYIRLTELIPELMDMVDEKKIALNPAYELSFLKKEEQVDLLDAMDSEQATPSLSQAQRLKKYSQEGHLTLDMMRVIMGEEKKSDLDRVTFTSDTLRKYFPKSYTPQRMQETIIKLLEQWQKKRQRDQER